MRNLLTSLLLLVALAGSLVVAATAPAGASVPGKPFTETLCEGDSDSIARLYTAGLGREPEQGGFDFWITEYTLGTWTFPRMAEFFVNSPEFQASYGTLNQDEFIRQLYRNVLGREGETGGVTFWNEQMSAGMSRATVLMRFAESPENITRSGTVEPTLGEFNEGRPAGHWRCGPSLAGSLLALGDFPTGWTQIPADEITQADVDRNTGCDGAFFMPVGTETTGFFDGANGVIQLGSYIAPTAHGADRYMAKVREGLLNCGSFAGDQGSTETATEISAPSYGDDSIAIRFELAPGTPNGVVAVAIVTQTGPVVTIVQNSSEPLDSAVTEAYAALIAERVASLFPT